MPVISSVNDLGHVLAVCAYGYGAKDAMSIASDVARGLGFERAVAFRAKLLGVNPDPSTYPSEFEVLVTVEGGKP